MTGSHRQQQGPSDGRRPPITALLWLLTVLSVLQWTAPAVDPALFARLSAGTPHDLGLAVAERPSPAVEARAATATIAFEKRSPSGRSLPPVDDAEAAPPGHPPASTAGRAAAGTAAPADEPRTLAGSTFAARGPPDLA